DIIIFQTPKTANSFSLFSPFSTKEMTTATRVAHSFVTRFYSTLNSNPFELHRFYKSDSVLTYSDVHQTSSETFHGSAVRLILSLLSSLLSPSLHSFLIHQKTPKRTSARNSSRSIFRIATSKSPLLNVRSLKGLCISEKKRKRKKIKREI